MSKVQGLNKRLEAMNTRLHPQPQRILPLPFVFLDEAGQAIPGCEESNQQAYKDARRLGIAPQLFEGIGPDEDGIEP